MSYHVPSADIRCHIVQREAARKWERDDWLPYIWESIDSLPQRVADLIAEGRHAEADYWIVQLEKFVGAITDAEFQRRVTELEANHGPIFV